MTYAFRQAGLSYIKYSNVAAAALRRALKPEIREIADKRAAIICKPTLWENGKPIKEEEEKSNIKK